MNDDAFTTTSVVDLDLGWTITGHLNGGYLAAMLSKTASDAVGGSDPLTVSAHYLAPVRGGGSADMGVDVVRRARLSTARVALSRGGVSMVEGYVTCGRAAAVAPSLNHAQPPQLPAWADCPDAGGGFDVPGMELLQMLELRPHPEDAAALSSRRPNARAHIRGWVGYRDRRPVDLLLALAAWDVFPPTPWVAGVWGRMPTVSAQVAFYSGEIRGPLIVEAWCDVLQDGIVDELARVWDSTRRLISTARQTAILLPA